MIPDDTILICGGAGYIGSHVTRCLYNRKCRLIVVDNLSTGHSASLPREVELVVGSIGDRAFLESIFASHKISAVVDLCANAYVQESVLDPRKYYDNNVVNGLVLLKTMLDFKVKNIVFSSSCTVYGRPEFLPVDEHCRIAPVSPYGHTKAIFEQIMADFCKAYGLHYVALRYFNAAGAYLDASIGEDHSPETHLVPLVLRQALHLEYPELFQGESIPMQIYGNDYETHDGTCMRDYIHVMDLATAHFTALKYLNDGGEAMALNLANECGFTNLELVQMCSRITGREIPYEIVDRRPGDSGVLVGASGKAREVLNWKPEYSDIETIIGSAWRWHRRMPEGFPPESTECNFK